MANVRTLPREEWRGYFDMMSSALRGKRAEIEVASLDLGDQIIAEWVGLLGITYDTGDDLIDVGLDNGSHLIRSPRTILVEEQPAGLASVTIETTDGTKQVVRLRDAMMLPPGVAAGAERGQGSRRR